MSTKKIVKKHIQFLDKKHRSKNIQVIHNFRNLIILLY